MSTAQTSLDPLPTTPIGKQQVIDLNAGAILRKEGNRKFSTFCGCSPALLLTIVMLLKCVVLAGWLYRENYAFDYGCPFVRMGEDFSEDKWKREVAYLPVRAKRSPQISDNYIVGNGKGQKKNRPVLGGSPALTTMVTMTNLQELPSANSSAKIKMKTIRQRVEEVRKRGDDMFEISMEEEDEPTIYLAPIQSRFDPMMDDSLYSTVPTTKAKKRKGKGNKKKHKTTPAQTTTTTETPITKKKKKGHGRKKLKHLDNRVVTEQTKSPRHLMAPVGQTTPTTTRPPGRGSFIEGGMEPADKKKANKGHIRGFEMKKATKKPKSGIKLSQETRMMWEMDELNYTTHAIQVKTTEMTKREEEISSFLNALPVFPLPPDQPVTTQAPAPVRDFYSSHVTSWSKKGDQVTKTPKQSTKQTTAAPVVVELRPENAVPKQWEPTSKPQPAAIYYETVVEPARKPLESTLAQLEKAADRQGFDDEKSEESDDLYEKSSPRKVKHGFDRSLDGAIDAGLADASNRPTSPPKQREIEDEDQKDRFQGELKSFTSNALCMVRTIFDTWCGCQILTALPYFIGICVAKRNFFVTHLLCDIFFLGAGFLCSITLLALSIILYVSVDEMTTTEFLHWLVFVFVIEVLLIVYTVVVYSCYKCSERLIVAKQEGYPKEYAQGALV